MASVTVALKDNEEGEWYSFLLSPEEESRLSQDPTFVSFLLNSVKKKKVTVVGPSLQSQVGGQTEVSTGVSLLNRTPEIQEGMSLLRTGSAEANQPRESKDVKIVTSLPPAPTALPEINSLSAEDTSGDIFEHRFVWNYQSVADLISLVRTKQAKFANPLIKRKNIWREIGKSMFEKGYPVTSDYCERKWRNLRGTYKAIVFKCQKNPNAKKSWEFFHALNDILKDDPNLNSLSVGGGNRLPEPEVEQPQPTTIRVVSAGGATYHIIEQPPPRPKAVPIRRNKTTSLLPCRIESVTSLGLPTTTATSAPVVLNNETSKSILAPSVSNPVTQGTGPSSNKRKATVTPEAEPEWFMTFKRELRESNERNLKEIREMHEENIRVLRERNDIIRDLVLTLLSNKEGSDTLTNNGT